MFTDTGSMAPHLEHISWSQVGVTFNEIHSVRIDGDVSREDLFRPEFWTAQVGYRSGLRVLVERHGLWLALEDDAVSEIGGDGMATGKRPVILRPAGVKTGKGGRTSYDEQDYQLVLELDELIRRTGNKEKSAWELAESAVGGGTRESKADRLLLKWREWSQR